MVTVNNLEEIKNVIPQLWNTYQQNISYICPDNYSAYYEGEFLEDPSGFNLHCDSDANWRKQNNKHTNSTLFTGDSRDPIKPSVFACIREY